MPTPIKARALAWGAACKGLPPHRWPSYEYEEAVLP
jgi:hypothetical protein